MAIVYPLLERAVYHLTHDVTIMLVFLLVLLCAYIAQKVFMEWWNLPPGPWGYPFFGILPMVGKEFHLFLYDLIKEYAGEDGMCSLKMGSQTVVVLSDWKVIKEAFGSTDFMARPKTELSSLLNGYGIVNSEGPMWSAHRSFLLNQKLGMKHIGTEIQYVERNVKREVRNLLTTFCENSPATFDPLSTIGLAVSNVICSMIMSKRFESGDPQFAGFMKNFEQGFKLYGETGGVDFIWVLKALPGIRSATKKLHRNRKVMLEFMKSVVQEHRDYIFASRLAIAEEQNTTVDKVPIKAVPTRDLIDAYLQEIDAPNFDKEKMFPGKDVEEQLQQTILDLFSAGVETLKTSIYWSLLFMIHNPDVMEKIRVEMEAVVGHDRLPDTSDIEQLVYTKAALHEVMRRASVVPMGTTHATDKCVNFRGYNLPKNTNVIPLLHAVHMNPEDWEDPEAFRPERFLSEDHKTFVKPGHFMPFGKGRRECLGDKLAERQFFLFFSSILHTMDISAEDPDNMPSLKSQSGITVTPSSYKINAVPRQEVRENLELLLQQAPEDTDLLLQTQTY